MAGNVIKRALISVTDKKGIVEFAKGLDAFGVEILSTGGTAAQLRKAGLTALVRSLTHFCLSQAVARRLDALSLTDIEIAAEPSLREVLASISNRTAHSDAGGEDDRS